MQCFRLWTVQHAYRKDVFLRRSACDFKVRGDIPFLFAEETHAKDYLEKALPDLIDRDDFRVVPVTVEIGGGA